MPDQISNKLGAYLDGELDQRGQIEVQAHLKTCLACQAELEELQKLSHLLRAAPLPEFIPAIDFKAQFMLQLPRRAYQQPEEQHPRPNGQKLLWMAPVLVLIGWIFIQVTLGLTMLVSLANQAGLLGGAAAWAAGSPQQMLWFTGAQTLFDGMLGPQGQTGLVALNDAGLIAQNLIFALLLQVGAAVIYWGALSLVWRDRLKVFWTSFTAKGTSFE